MSHSRNPSHRCTVCRHDERSRIEYLMAAGVSKRSIAERFGVSADAAWRHWTHHVGPHMKAALVTKSLKPGVELAALVEQEGLGLLEHLQNIRGKLYTVFDAAIEAGDRNAVTGLGRELRENLTLVAKLHGRLVAHAQTNIQNVILSPSYLDLRANLIRALAPFPEAARAVSEALRGAETAAEAEMARQPMMIEARAEAAHA